MNRIISTADADLFYCSSSFLLSNENPPTFIVTLEQGSINVIPFVLSGFDDKIVKWFSMNSTHVTLKKIHFFSLLGWLRFDLNSLPLAAKHLLWLWFYIVLLSYLSHNKYMHHPLHFLLDNGCTFPLCSRSCVYGFMVGHTTHFYLPWNMELRVGIDII